MNDEESCDVAIVGGGPAGLSCALWLGRYRRRVRVFDTGEPRNRPAWGVHGFPGISDPPPLELRALMRQQAIDAGAQHGVAEIIRIEGNKDAFQLHTADGKSFVARRVVLAYGLRDFVPDVPGIRAFYGRSIYHCPDCDGPTVLDGSVGVIGHDRHAVALALYLLTWTSRVSILANGETPDFTAEARALLDEQKIDVRTEPITALHGENGHLQEAVIGDGVIALDAIFFHLGSEPGSPLAADCGCDTDEEGFIVVDNGQQTSIPGIYAAGDLAGLPHLAVTAAAEGVRAALAIHRSLTPDRFFVGG